MSICIETAGLVLKKASFEDWRSIWTNLWRHGESARYMLWSPTENEDEAKARMERTIAFEASHPYALLVYEKLSGECIGFAGMEETDPGVFEDMGVALGPDYVGRGYGKQVLTALVRYAFDTLGGRKFICTARRENTASIALQRACGFAYSRSEKRTDPRNGEDYTLDLYELHI